MGNGQREGMALLIFGVNTLAQSIELAQECTSSIHKIAAWNIQVFRPIFEGRIQEPLVARNFLDAQVIAAKTYHRGK